MAANAQKNKFLIDGFPRNQDNLQGWNKTMDGKADVSFVLFFDCNNEVIKTFICSHGLSLTDGQLLGKNKVTFYLSLHFIWAAVLLRTGKWMNGTVRLAVGVLKTVRYQQPCGSKICLIFKITSICFVLK